MNVLKGAIDLRIKNAGETDDPLYRIEKILQNHLDAFILNKDGAKMFQDCVHLKYVSLVPIFNGKN